MSELRNIIALLLWLTAIPALMAGSEAAAVSSGQPDVRGKDASDKAPAASAEPPPSPRKEIADKGGTSSSEPPQPTNKLILIDNGSPVMRYVDSGKLKEAVDEVTRQRAMLNRSLGVIHEKALRMAKDGKYDESVAVLDKLLEIRYDTPVIYSDKIIVLCHSGNNAEAVKVYQALPKEVAVAAPARKEIALAFGGLGRYAEALPLFEASLDQYGNDEKFVASMVNAYVGSGQRGKAVEYLGRRVSSENNAPGWVRPLWIKLRHDDAIELAKAGKVTEAITQLKMLVDDTQDRKAIYHDYIVCLAGAHRNDEAIAAYGEIAASDDLPVPVLTAVYGCYQAAGSETGMFNVAKKLALSDPFEMKRVDLVVTCCEKADRPEDGMAIIEALLKKHSDRKNELTPYLARFGKALANRHIKNGEYEKAVEVLQRLIKEKKSGKNSAVQSVPAEVKPSVVVEEKKVVEAKPVVEVKPSVVVEEKKVTEAKPVVEVKPSVVVEEKKVVESKPVAEAKPSVVVEEKKVVESKPVVEIKPSVVVEEKKSQVSGAATAVSTSKDVAVTKVAVAKAPTTVAVEKSVPSVKAAAPDTSKATSDVVDQSMEKALGETFIQKRTDIYLQALVMVKDFKELRRVLAKVIAATPGTDSMRLMRLAQYGMENNLNDVAAEAYEKLLKYNPGNLTAIRNIGTALYAERKYEPALKFMNDYNRRTGGDYVTNYTQGELSYLMRKKLGEAAAKPFFEKALKEATKMGPEIKDAQIICAKCLFRLGKYVESFAIFDRLEKKYPNDVYVLIDYATMLFEAGFVNDAYRELKKLPEDLYRPGALARYMLEPEQLDEVIVKVMTIRIAYQLQHRNFFLVKEMEKELQKRYPNSPDAALSRAAYYASYDNWRGEIQSVREALKAYPNDETLVLENQRLSRLHGSYVENKTGVRLSDNNGTEVLTENRLELRLTDDIRLGINNVTDFANLHAVPNRDGDESAFNGVRNQFEFFLQGDLINGDKAKISLFSQDGIPGVGGSYTLLDYWGNTKLGGSFREPYWGQQQAIMERGSRTYVELERVLRPYEGLTLSGAGSVNSYGLQYSQDLARSYEIGARAEYELPKWKWQKDILGDMSAITLNYEFDYEYFYYNKTNRDDVAIYDPSNRQVHSAYLQIAKEFGFGLRATASGGYAFDVLGDGSGPIYGLSLAYLLTEELEVSATVNQVVSSNKYFYAGVGLKYNFTPLTLVELYNKYH